MASPSETRPLRARWHEEPFVRLADEVVHRLAAGESLDSAGLPIVDGRTDLRGLSLPKPKVLATSSMKVKGVQGPLTLNRTAPRLVVKNLELRHADFSYGDVTETSWHACRFEDVRFTGGALRDVTFWSCRFEDVSFERADLRGTVLGGVAGSEPNEYVRVSFANADLRRTTHLHPLYQDCDFSHANVDNVEFKASRLVRCKFSGRMHGTWFWGRYEIPHPADVPYLGKRRIDPRSIVNPMEDVDFSGASLEYCMFTFGADLSRCRFPQDGIHIVLRDRLRTYARMEEEVKRDWAEPERTQALDFLRRQREDPRKAGQAMEVFNPEESIRIEGAHLRLKPSERAMLRKPIPWKKPLFELMRKCA